MFIFNISDPLTKIDEPCQDDIHLFLQYFIHSDPYRARETRECLRQNVLNPIIDYIHLLGERLYTESELGVKSAKIIQTVINKRLCYSDFFEYVRTRGIKGYHILANSDIFFNGTLSRIKYSDLHLSQKTLALLRYEYNSLDIKKSKLFGPRSDSQDTWIFHSNFPIKQRFEKQFRFELGKPGCDNKLLYLLFVLGYDIINDPVTINTFHYHSSNIRNYTKKDVVPFPYLHIKPAYIGYNDFHETPNERVTMNDNTVLRNYISNKLSRSEHFIIPRISSIETVYATYVRMIQTNLDSGTRANILNVLNNPNMISEMKKETGILITSPLYAKKYSQLYFAAFEDCELYGGLDKKSWLYRSSHQNAQDYIENTYNDKRIFWTYTFDIFHYIYSQPWTLALRGKRILLVTPNEQLYQDKIPIREKMYGIDLFPECSFLTITPPDTIAGSSSDTFTEELERFYKRLDCLESHYDIALVNGAGYSAIICKHIFGLGRSAIEVGSVLQMYFGILGNQWLKERPDIVRMFLNEYWSRI